MKHYRATPVRGTPGEPIVARGLHALVMQAKEQFGLLATYESVRAKAYLKDVNKVFRCAGEGFVQIEAAPDADEAYAAAEINAALNDDRAEDYQGIVVINYKDTGWTRGEDGTEFKSGTLRAKGLMNLLREAQAYVREKLGALPPSMEEDEIAKRLPNIRAQMSKSRATEHAQYPIPFPTLKDDYWKAPNNWPVRIFVAIDAKYEAPPIRLGFKRRD